MKSNNCTVLDNSNVNEVPITNEEYEHIVNMQKEVLSLTIQEVQTQLILDKICNMLESLLPNAVASLMLKEADSHIYVKAAPTIPPAGWDALNGIKPGPHSGSCGNAVFQGKPQYITDVLTDERGTEFLQTAQAFNLCSCWSMPVKDEKATTIGSIALSSFEHRNPAPFHKKLLDTASSMITIVLKNEQHHKKIERMLYIDCLTGLKNKTSLQEELQVGTFNTLLFLDINNFSYINTAYGFDIGDTILVDVATTLKELFKVGLYRINADQYAVRFEEKIDLKELVIDIKKHFTKHTVIIGEIKLKISFTYGGVYADHNHLQYAALAIKKAKESGKNKLHIFDQERDSTQNREAFIAMNSKIYSAFEENMVVPYFQGLYDNEQHKITKYEALVRIIDKDGKILSPFAFLDVAKLSGLLPKLTRVMVAKTFEFMKNNSYDFSINITEDDLSANYLLGYLEDMSQKFGIEPYRVTLEILEGISAKGQKNNIAQLKKLKHQGYKLAIDDFGAEYSNFERVLELDVDFLKIDARYIKNIDKDKKSYEIVKAIVNFSQNMYITVVAEFVHSAEVQEVVESLGINYSQGYYFSEPTKELTIEPLNS